MKTSETIKTRNVVHLLSTGPFDYTVDWQKGGGAATITICNYVIKASKEKARYMATNSYVFLSDATASAPAGDARRRLSLSTKGFKLADFDIRDAARVSIAIVSPHSYVSEVKYSLIASKTP